MAGSALEYLKPFGWMAVAACAMGLGSFLVLGDAGAHPVARRAAHYVPIASAPASDDWNLPKHI